MIIDLFGGPGGWDEGLCSLGFDPSQVLGIDIDPVACRTAVEAGHRRIVADVAAMRPEALDGVVSGIVASPPCPGFSVAGKGAGRADLDHILRIVAMIQRADLCSVDVMLQELRRGCADPRSHLVLEPLRWVLKMHEWSRPWLAWEQVPSVLPVWQASAQILESMGYRTWTGIVHAERYGVPQTRRRAVLLARYMPSCPPGHPSAPGEPRPTHSRYNSRHPYQAELGLPLPVSMAQALGWGMTPRPSMTVTGGGVATGGAEPFGNGARQGMIRERDAGRWAMRSKYGTWGDSAARGLRAVESPAPTITSKAGRNFWTAPGEEPIRVTVAEAAALQTFRPDYPWQGTKGEQYLQIGNAVPPLLARYLTAEAMGAGLVPIVPRPRAEKDEHVSS